MEFVSAEWWILCFRWFHVLSGIMWIGHLWYFNFTQTPTVPKIPAELRPGDRRASSCRKRCSGSAGARWATIVFGLILADMNGYLGEAIIIGIGQHSAHITAIGIGMWLGTIMWANVWFIIWPNQQMLHRHEADRRTRSAADRARRGACLARQHAAVDPDGLLHDGDPLLLSVSRFVARWNRGREAPFPSV